MSKFSFLLFIMIFTLCYPISIVGRQSSGYNRDLLLDKGSKAASKEKYAEAIRYFFEARDAAKVHDDKEGILLATYNIGVCYFSVNALGDALKFYNEALAINNKYKLHRDELIENGIAGVYFGSNNYNKAEQMCKKILNSALSRHDSSSVATYASDLALITNKYRRFNLSQKYLSLAERWSKRNDYNSRAKVKMVKAEALYLQKKYDELLRLAPQYTGDKYISASDKALIYIYQIEIHADRGQYAEAHNIALKTRKYMVLYRLPDYFATLSTVCKHLGLLEEALNYKDSLLAVNDSIEKITNEELLDQNKAKLEVLMAKTNLDKKVEQLNKQKLIAIFIIIICLLLLIMCILAYQTQRVKNRAAQQEMKLSIREKNNELAATKMFVTSRNELISNLLEKLGSMQSFDVVEVKRLIMELKQMLKDNSKQDEFLINFEKANPDFSKKIQQLHPNLSASDIRFLAYIRMDLTTKEIAMLINITPDSCKRRKIRISKKMGLASSAELYSYINQL